MTDAGAESLATLSELGTASAGEMASALALVSQSIARVRVAPAVVALAGNVGVGKSTLIDALLALRGFLCSTVEQLELGPANAIGLKENFAGFDGELATFLREAIART